MLEDSRISRQARMFKGKQTAAFAKSGLLIAGGSSLEILADTAYQFAMDRALNLRSGLLESQYLVGQANIQTAQGKWAERYGREQKRTAYINAAGTILSSGFAASQGGGSTAAGAGSPNLTSGSSYGSSYTQNFGSSS